MIRFFVDIYNYSSATGAITYLISGYTHSTQWIYPNAKSFSTGTDDSKANLKVRFGYDGAKTCVWIGETNTTWNYPKVFIRDVEGGFGDNTASDFYTGWNINIVTSFNTIDSTYEDANKWHFTAIAGAIWNDYAEYRQSAITEPGRCVHEVGDDTLAMTDQRLQPGCEIVSDTFGFAIGETEECKTPVAASGRVLAYIYEGREFARTHIGWPVCSGPNGTVSVMTQ